MAWQIPPALCFVLEQLYQRDRRVGKGVGTAFPLRPSLSYAVPTRSFASAWTCDRVGTALWLRSRKRMPGWPAPLPTLQLTLAQPPRRWPASRQSYKTFAMARDLRTIAMLSPRLSLRSFTAADAADSFAAATSTVARFMGWDPAPSLEA